MNDAHVAAIATMFVGVSGLVVAIIGALLKSWVTSIRESITVGIANAEELIAEKIKHVETLLQRHELDGLRRHQHINEFMGQTSVAIEEIRDELRKETSRLRERIARIEAHTRIGREGGEDD